MIGRRWLARREASFVPARVVDAELDEDFEVATDCSGYRRAFVIVRVGGVPAGALTVPCADGRVTPEAIRRAIADDRQLRAAVSYHDVRRWLLAKQPAVNTAPPTWSVVICTRDRIHHLVQCLEALRDAAAHGGEVIVVDNDPPNDATARLAARYPVTYVREPRRGLNTARMTGARAAKGEIVIYTDDDVIIDPRWTDAMVAPFAAPRVGAVSGLTLPYEMETYAQAVFEQYGGHGRGFWPKVFDMMEGSAPASGGRAGSGANMAFRRSLILDLGLFDAPIDMGTPAMTGGDAHAFYLVLAAGYRIQYTPAAVVRHRHRREYDATRHMVYGYNVGGFAHLLRCWIEHGDWEALYIAAVWLRKHHIKQLGCILTRMPHALPLDWVLAEIWGCLCAPLAYWRSRSRGPVPRQRVRVSTQQVPA